ncbi:MAG TPA: bifunctional DNA primase/polymerase [Gemmataceae bacterium]|jgi:hypothetical protein|nr:bifunctional DNA primase/polymerase [Gemmataceae bacterium]
MNDFTREAALLAHDLGYRVVLMVENSKRPMMAGWQEKVMERGQIDFWLRRYPLNYGILIGERTGVAVLDKDGRSAATSAFLKQHKASSPMEVLTPNLGVHGYFRIPTTLREKRTKIKWLGLGLDVKLSGCAVGRGSAVNGRTYRLKAGKKMVAINDLPDIPDGIITMLNKTIIKTINPVRFESRSQIRDPKAYCLKVESHQGFNGSSGLVRCVCVCRDAAMSSQETFDFLVSEWNRPPRVSPMWSTEEIAYAIRRHFQPR